MIPESSDSLRVAILSDTHGYICPEILKVVEQCHMAVHAGDIGGKRVLELLETASGDLRAVRGNNDVPGLWASGELPALDQVPDSMEVKLPGGRLAVEHGHAHGWRSPDTGKLRAAHPGVRAIVYGHTHKLEIDQAESPWILNPGAAGRVRTHGGPSCLVLSAGEESWEIERFGFPPGGEFKVASGSCI